MNESVHSAKRLHLPPLPIPMHLHSREQLCIAFGLEGMDGHQGFGVHGCHEALEVGGTGVAGGVQDLEGDAVGIGPVLEGDA